MASNNPDSENDSPKIGEPLPPNFNTNFHTPRTPRLVPVNDGEQLPPDTEEHVRDETEIVFLSFTQQMHQHEAEREQEQYGATPSFTELTGYEANPLGHASQVGRQLAQIGDDLNERYATQFRDMVRILHITPDTAYEAFAGVARKLFHDGVITWGRVITLLCFGYRIAVQVFQSGIRGFFSKIISFVCKFIYQERIAKWIAEQGGWVAALGYIPESIGWSGVAMILGLAAAVISVVSLLRR